MGVALAPGATAWTALYIATGAIPALQDALHFSTATFATIGSLNSMLYPDLRLFSSIEGIDGFILIGWSTAYLVAASTRHGPLRSGGTFLSRNSDYTRSRPCSFPYAPRTHLQSRTTGQIGSFGSRRGTEVGSFALLKTGASVPM